MEHGQQGWLLPKPSVPDRVQTCIEGLNDSTLLLVWARVEHAQGLPCTVEEARAALRWEIDRRDPDIDRLVS